jgi:hypothetical protein
MAYHGKQLIGIEPKIKSLEARSYQIVDSRLTQTPKMSSQMSSLHSID